MEGQETRCAGGISSLSFELSPAKQSEVGGSSLEVSPLFLAGNGRVLAGGGEQVPVEEKEMADVDREKMEMAKEKFVRRIQTQGGGEGGEDKEEENRAWKEEEGKEKVEEEVVEEEEQDGQTEEREERGCGGRRAQDVEVYTSISVKYTSMSAKEMSTQGTSAKEISADEIFAEEQVIQDRCTGDGGEEGGGEGGGGGGRRRTRRYMNPCQKSKEYRTN